MIESVLRLNGSDQSQARRLKVGTLFSTTVPIDVVDRHGIEEL